MAKTKQNSLKATKNRDRVNFHRKWKKIAAIENRSINLICNVQSQTSNQKKEETLASNEKLRQWATKYNISKRAISELLKILISFGLNWLPKDSRTLLATPRFIEMTNLTNGKLWYGFYGFFSYSNQ